MPKYQYYCDICKYRYYIWHGMEDTLSKCDKCGGMNEYLTRIPSMVSDVKKYIENKKVGSIVEQHIEDTKKEVNAEKKIMRKDLDL